MPAKKPPKILPDDEREEVSWPEEKKVEQSGNLPDVERAEQHEEDVQDANLTAPQNKIIDDEIINENKEVTKPTMDPQEPQQNQNSSFGLEMKEQPRGGRNRFLIIGIILLVLALAGGGYFFYKNMNGSSSAEATPSESPFVVMASPAASPLASEAPTSQIDRSEWSIEVLNGTGKTGLAAEVKTKLEDMGYTVSKIGNSSETETTKISINKKMADQQDAFLADLSDLFSVDTAGTLSDSSASARIVVGKDYLK